MNDKAHFFAKGLKEGIPVASGYFAVAFSLGIVARNSGLSAFQGFLASLLNTASAGEYSLFESIREGVTYAELALSIFVINIRYFLMSCSLSQRFAPSVNILHRFFTGFGITDEIFALSVSQKNYSPFYTYGIIAIAVPAWSIATAIGVCAGTILPLRVVSALSVALFGMFLAIIIPPVKKDKAVAACVISSFVLSYLSSVLPYVRTISGGMRTVVLTLVISAVMAFISPLRDSQGASDEE
ncbi:AzlC family ABC transporter permease [Treponema sp.]|uniref:AzlC family ABC transporter permease n=1 Tax=Treponema sp. TaxID=166 RepID=UPI0025FC8207|nr:AzlC family ABC transporter permease [Treponema sp.]MCR5218666.1 AzlC family ABC transporter permease [Treponema sp.]